jgi:predicted dehydrogenase/threonine dehydrogenase-like Zn-dependent dehydrogenase
VGERVVSNGPHAEIVCVPHNLCAKVPDEVNDEEAAFTVVGAIALQGSRLAKPTLGESFAVIGLGLIGQIAVQVLNANGCRVLGIDIDKGRCELAQQFGAEIVDLSKGEDPVSTAMAFSHGKGIDGVIITAATKSDEPVHQAAQMCRKRGRIVLVGVTGLELSRDDFYRKELSFQVSCSYGPGRYDPEYEEKGHDYPIGFVRWTEKRNFEAVLNLMSTGKLDVRPLITHRFKFEEAIRAYDLISENTEPYLGIILNYSEKQSAERIEHSDKKTTIVLEKTPGSLPNAPSEPVIGLIGAGNYALSILLPALSRTKVKLAAVADINPVAAAHAARKFGFEQSTTDIEGIFNDTSINTVFITTRHNTHYELIIKALKSGKHVFVEKPLCINEQELNEIISVYSSIINRQSSIPILMVGFNRRFAPHDIKIKELLSPIKEPKGMIMTVNAGMIQADHWTQDPDIGGGRIIGEACHFIDLLRFLTGSEIVSSEIVRLDNRLGDTVTIQLSFKDGSIGTIHYFANGSKRFPKERLEMFTGQKILQLDNFKTLKGYGFKGFNMMKLWRQDKGHRNEMKAFIDSVRDGKPSPIQFEEIIEVTKITLELSSKT